MMTSTLCTSFIPVIDSSLSETCSILATTSARLLKWIPTTAYGSSTTVGSWMDIGLIGVLTLIVERIRSGSLFSLNLYECGTSKVIYRQELYVGFIYHLVSPSFHCFESDVAMIGITFPIAEDMATEFARKVIKIAANVSLPPLTPSTPMTFDSVKHGVMPSLLPVDHRSQSSSVSSEPSSAAPSVHNSRSHEPPLEKKEKDEKNKKAGIFSRFFGFFGSSKGDLKDEDSKKSKTNSDTGISSREVSDSNDGEYIVIPKDVSIRIRSSSISSHVRKADDGSLIHHNIPSDFERALNMTNSNISVTQTQEDNTMGLIDKSSQMSSKSISNNVSSKHDARQNIAPSSSAVHKSNISSFLSSNAEDKKHRSTESKQGGHHSERNADSRSSNVKSPLSDVQSSIHEHPISLENTTYKEISALKTGLPPPPPPPPVLSDHQLRPPATKKTAKQTTNVSNNISSTKSCTKSSIRLVISSEDLFAGANRLKRVNVQDKKAMPTPKQLSNNIIEHKNPTNDKLPVSSGRLRIDADQLYNALQRLKSAPKKKSPMKDDGSGKSNSDNVKCNNGNPLMLELQDTLLRRLAHVRNVKRGGRASFGVPEDNDDWGDDS